VNVYHAFRVYSKLDMLNRKLPIQKICPLHFWGGAQLLLYPSIGMPQDTRWEFLSLKTAGHALFTKMFWFYKILGHVGKEIYVFKKYLFQTTYMACRNYECYTYSGKNW
jgi:hypothetical protein